VSQKPIGLAPGASLDAAGQDERKYSTSNPVVLRLIRRWLSRLRTLTGEARDLVLDVGVGEGLALEQTSHSNTRLIGIDFRHDKLLRARDRLPNLTPLVADAGMLPIGGGRVPIVTCIEVLEHLVRPEQAIAELARVTATRCVVSVPWEPWFRLGNLARGKNIARIGNDPEHIQAFTPRRLSGLLRRSFRTVEVHKTFPWLVAVATDPLPQVAQPESPDPDHGKRR
jgi:hypothetical protein